MSFVHDTMMYSGDVRSISCLLGSVARLVVECGDVHGLVAVISIPSTQESRAKIVSGHVAREGNIANGPFEVVYVCDELRLVQIAQHPLGELRLVPK